MDKDEGKVHNQIPGGCNAGIVVVLVIVGIVSLVIWLAIEGFWQLTAFGNVRYAQEFHEGVAWARIGRRWTLFDTDGNALLQLRGTTTEPTRVYQGAFVVDGRMINLQGEVVAAFGEEFRVVAARNRFIGYAVLDKTVADREERFIVRGVVGPDGNWAVPLQRGLSAADTDVFFEPAAQTQHDVRPADVDLSRYRFPNLRVAVDPVLAFFGGGTRLEVINPVPFKGDYLAVFHLGANNVPYVVRVNRLGEEVSPVFKIADSPDEMTRGRVFRRFTNNGLAYIWEDYTGVQLPARGRAETHARQFRYGLALVELRRERIWSDTTVRSRIYFVDQNGAELNFGRASARRGTIIIDLSNEIETTLDIPNEFEHAVLFELPDSSLFHPRIAEQAALYSMLAYSETRMSGLISSTSPLLNLRTITSAEAYFERYAELRDMLLDVGAFGYLRSYGDVSAFGYSFSVEQRVMGRNWDDPPTLLRMQMEVDGFDGIEHWNYGDPYGYNASYTFAYQNLGRGEYLVAVIFRGTDGPEWYGNFEVGLGYRHGSFERANSGAGYPGEYGVQGHIREYLRRNGINGTVHFFVTGHSRGGSVANLLAADMLSGRFDPGLPVGEVFAYTFAAQNTARQFTEGSFDNIFNFVFYDDFATHVPFDIDGWGFGRYGTTFGITAYDNYMGDSEAQLAFRNAMHIFALLSPDAPDRPEFSSYRTDALIAEMKRLAPDLHSYYGSYLNTYDDGVMTPFEFMHNYIATAVILRHESWQGVGIFLDRFPSWLFKAHPMAAMTYVAVTPPHEFSRFAGMFLEHGDIFKSTHFSFTYWAAVMLGLFDDVTRSGTIETGDGVLPGFVLPEQTVGGWLPNFDDYVFGPVPNESALEHGEYVLR